MEYFLISFREVTYVYFIFAADGPTQRRYEIVWSGVGDMGYSLRGRYNFRGSTHDADGSRVYWIRA